MACSVRNKQDADPLFDLLRQEGADHGEDWPKEHWLIDQVDSSHFQRKGVLNIHHHRHTPSLSKQCTRPFSQYII